MLSEGRSPLRSLLWGLRQGGPPREGRVSVYGRRGRLVYQLRGGCFAGKDSPPRRRSRTTTSGRTTIRHVTAATPTCSRVGRMLLGENRGESEQQGLGLRRTRNQPRCSIPGAPQR